MSEKQVMGSMPRWLIVTTVVVPVLLIAGVLLVINYPNWTMKMNYDFVYATCGWSGQNISYSVDRSSHVWVSCGDFLSQRFAVVEGKLEVRDDLRLLARLPDPVGTESELYQADEVSRMLGVRLFIHDTKANVSMEIEPEELEGKRIISTTNAPDGTHLKNQRVRSADPFFFFGSYGYSVNLLVQGEASREMDVVVNVNSNQFRKLGWLER